MQLDDADAGDVGKEKEARPPCGMTRDDSDRRQCEKDEDDVLGGPAPALLAAFRGGTDDADALLGATAPGAEVAAPPAEAAADGDGGHHVLRDAEARKVTRWDCDDAAAAAAGGTSSPGAIVALLRLLSFLLMAGGGGGGGGGGAGSGLFLERPGRRKHAHLRMPPPAGASGSLAQPFATLTRRGGGGRALLLLVCRGSAPGARGTFSLAEEAIGAEHGGLQPKEHEGFFSQAWRGLYTENW
jgi:hypothetical protein